MQSLQFPPNFIDVYTGTTSNDLLHISSVGFQNSAAWNFYTNRPNGSLDWQIIFLKEGCGHFQFKDTVEIIKSPSLIIFKPAEPQQYIYYTQSAPSTCYIHFSGTIVLSLLNKFGLIPNESHNVFQVDEINGEHIRRMFENIKLTLDFYPSDNHFCWGGFIELLSTFSVCIKNDNYYNSPIPSSHKEFVQIVLKDINDNYNLNRTLKEYAAMVQMSPSYFSHVFKNAVGISPIEYRKRIRIEQAKLLLTSTDKSVKDISEHVGYPEPSLFIKRFKSLVGITPYQYRRMPNHSTRSN